MPAVLAKRDTHLSTSRRALVLTVLALSLVVAITSCDDEPEPGSPPGPYAGSVAAPEFPAGLTWLNTGGEALTLEELHGKVVVLNFWAPSCINCTHTQRELERLLDEFSGSLEVVGVQLPLLPHEADRESARHAVIRSGIDQPTVHDAALEVWRLWDGSVLPTTTVIDPAGNLVGRHTGEGVYETIRPVVESLINEFADSMDRTQVQRPLERESRLPTILSYPAGIAADSAHGVAYISDTGNNRIVAAEIPGGDVVAVYGDGVARLRDGSATEASFSSPRGLAVTPDGATLYVADTGNHAIRAVDLASGSVTTVAGTGALGPLPAVEGQGQDTPLRSPYDVEVRPGEVLVAMAGSNQVWRIDLQNGEAKPLAGSGEQGTSDGSGTNATMSQPSGLTLDESGAWLYYTDAGSNSVRRVNLDDATVETVLAGGPDSALLQYPIGLVAVPSEGVIVTDAYDHRLAELTAAGTVTSLSGGPAGWRDGSDPRFYQPEAIDFIGSTLVVADTLNHAIRLVDLDSGSASTIVFRGIEAFQPVPGDDGYRGSVIELPTTEVAEGDGEVVIDISLPVDHKVNEQAPSSVTWTADGGVVAFAAGQEPSLTGVTFPVRYPVRFVQGQGTLTADIDLFWCANDAESLCFIEQLRLVAPMEVGESGGAELVLRHTVSLPESSP